MASRLSRTGGGTNTLSLSQRYRTRYRAEICWAVSVSTRNECGPWEGGSKRMGNKFRPSERLRIDFQVQSGLEEGVIFLKT